MINTIQIISFILIAHLTLSGVLIATNATSTFGQDSYTKAITQKTAYISNVGKDSIDLSNTAGLTDTTYERTPGDATKMLGIWDVLTSLYAGFLPSAYLLAGARTFIESVLGWGLALFQGIEVTICGILIYDKVKNKKVD